MYTNSPCSFAGLHKAGDILNKEKASGSQLCLHKFSALPPGRKEVQVSALVLHRNYLQHISESPLGCSELHSGASNHRRTSLVIRSI